MDLKVLELVGAGQALDLGEYSALSDYSVVVPRMNVAVAPSSTVSTKQSFRVSISNSFGFVWSGLRANWSHANFLIQLFDPFGQAMQSAPALGPLVLIGLIGRPIVPMTTYLPGAELTGDIYNLDTGSALTLDLNYLGIKAARPVN